MEALAALTGARLDDRVQARSPSVGSASRDYTGLHQSLATRRINQDDNSRSMSKPTFVFPALTKNQIAISKIAHTKRSDICLFGLSAAGLLGTIARVVDLDKLQATGARRAMR